MTIIIYDSRHVTGGTYSPADRRKRSNKQRFPRHDVVFHCRWGRSILTYYWCYCCLIDDNSIYCTCAPNAAVDVHRKCRAGANKTNYTKANVRTSSNIRSLCALGSNTVLYRVYRPNGDRKYSNMTLYHYSIRKINKSWFTWFISDTILYWLLYLGCYEIYQANIKMVLTSYFLYRIR